MEDQHIVFAGRSELWQAAEGKSHHEIDLAGKYILSGPIGSNIATAVFLLNENSGPFHFEVE